MYVSKYVIKYVLCTFMYIYVDVQYIWRSGFLSFYEQHIPEVKAQLINDNPHPEYNYRTSVRIL